MQINADFSQWVAVHASRLPWQPSPIPGVDRRMLDRIGKEVARATSIVRYAPNSRFPTHTHGGGEEFFVLDGVFSDEHGDYPPGSYIRNPPSSSHKPHSEPGCVIFVKLWQFDPSDRTQIRTETNKMPFTSSPVRRGVDLMPLFSNPNENVRLERWAPDTVIEIPAPGGLEVLVLGGDFYEGSETFGSQAWLRLPPSATLRATAGTTGCKVWLKSDHLARPQFAPAE